MKTGRETLKNHVRIALAVMVLAAITAGFPAYGQAKNGGQGKQGAAGGQAAPAQDPELTPLDSGTAAGAASGTAAGAASGTAAGAASGTAAGAASGTASDAASGTAAPAASLGVSTWDFVRALLVLALVVAAIYLLFHLLKKGMGRKNPENDMIRMLGTRNLSGNRTMHLIEVGKSVFLVGSTDGGVELISEITDQESLDMVRLKAAEEPTGPRRGFQEILADILKPGKKPSSMNDGLRFLKSQRERLKKL